MIDLWLMYKFCGTFALLFLVLTAWVALWFCILKLQSRLLLAAAIAVYLLLCPAICWLLYMIVALQRT